MKARTIVFFHISHGHRATSTALGQLPVNDGLTVELAPDVLDALGELRALKAQVAALKDPIAAAENRVKAALGDATEGTDDTGVQVVSWREQTRTAIDAAGLRKQHPDIAAAYTTTTKSRVLRLTTSKGKK